MILLREITVQEPASIICDRCGRRAEKASDTCEFDEYLSLDHVGGYGSIIGDGTRLKLDICQHCIKELLFPFARISRQ
jgi:hypothetical protein